MRKKITRIAVFTLVICPIAFSALSFYFAKTFISPHRVPIGNPPVNTNYKFENVTFKSPDGLNLKGWYSKPDSLNIVIIFLHGYSANRLEMLPRALMFKQHGYGALLFDSRACGESEGDEISLGYYEQNDLLGAIEFLKKNQINEFGLDGFSQGGATIIIASDKFTDVNIRFAVLESTYSDLRTAIDNRYKKYLGIPGWLGGCLMIPFAEWMLNADIDNLKPSEKISNLKCPVMLLSGSDDELTKVNETESLYNNAGSPKQLYIVKGAKHEDLYKFNPKIYEDNVMKFLTEMSFQNKSK